MMASPSSLKTIQKASKRPSYLLLIAAVTYLAQKSLKLTLNPSNSNTGSGLTNKYFISSLFDTQNAGWLIDESNEVLRSGWVEFFDDYLGFMVLSLILNLIMIIIVKTKKDNLKGLNNFEKSVKDENIKEARSIGEADVQNKLMRKLVEFVKSFIKGGLFLYTDFLLL